MRQPEATNLVCNFVKLTWRTEARLLLGHMVKGRIIICNRSNIHYFTNTYLGNQIVGRTVKGRLELWPLPLLLNLLSGLEVPVVVCVAAEVLLDRLGVLIS